ncbi:MAG: hypothetical protein WAV41_01545 [Microgenomates group bacterium]
MKNIALVGVGPHARKIYYPLLEKYQAQFNIHLSLVIDLEDQRSKIERFILESNLKPEKSIYLDNNDHNRLGDKLDPIAEKELDLLVSQRRIDGIIIATEPKAHNIYLKWATDNNIPILLDKPITSPVGSNVDIESSKKVYRDFLEIEQMVKKSKGRCYVSVQRRSHDGYIFIRDYLNDFIKQYGVPISYFDSYFADGTWTMPNEFEKENHPYKYGYGKLMHSGYHGVDLFSWITELNDQVVDKKPNQARLYVNSFSPVDFFHQINQQNYEKLFGKSENITSFFEKYQEENFKNYGELDVFIMLQLLRDNKVVTTGSITLQQNSFSRRAWLDLPEDTYKGNGRLRHERQNIQVSNLLNIQVHTYQAYEARNRATESIEGVGNEHHFDIYLFRNSGLVGGKNFEKIDFGQDMKKKNEDDIYYMGHNEKGKDNILLKFLNNEEDNSELSQQDRTNKILAKVCEALAAGRNNNIPYVTFEI